MPVLDIVVNPSGALSGARTVQRSLADIGRSAVGMERTMGGAVGRLKGMLAGLVAAVAGIASTLARARPNRAEALRILGLG